MALPSRIQYQFDAEIRFGTIRPDDKACTYIFLAGGWYSAMCGRVSLEMHDAKLDHTGNMRTEFKAVPCQMCAEFGWWSRHPSLDPRPATGGVVTTHFARRH